MKERWWLDLVPRWFRFRWPLKRYYWQPQEIEESKREANRLREQAALIADAHICGCGDHATEVGRKIRELPIE